MCLLDTLPLEGKDRRASAGPRQHIVTLPALCCALQSNGGRASYGVVKVTDPKHTVMSWTAQGLPPGLPYTFTVTPL